MTETGVFGCPGAVLVHQARLPGQFLDQAATAWSGPTTTARGDESGSGDRSLFGGAQAAWACNAASCARAFRALLRNLRWRRRLDSCRQESEQISGGRPGRRVKLKGSSHIVQRLVSINWGSSSVPGFVQRAALLTASA